MALNEDQAAAVDAFTAFKDSGDTTFALLGYAGTGKSFTEAHLLQHHIVEGAAPRDDGSTPFTNPFTLGASEVLIAAPTHKAINVCRRFFNDITLRHEVGYDKFFHAPGVPITGTTAQLIGLRPIITDDQSASKLNFGQAGPGLLDQLKDDVKWVVIDEVSMLSQPHLETLERAARAYGFKILVIGDPGQLPPVEAAPIDYDAIKHVAYLKQIMRQAGDSAIPHLAAAVRAQQDWSQVTGGGVDHFANPAGAFIDEVSAPPAPDERDRMVFVAYRNARVNAVQEAACQKVYGHGRLTIAPGETIIASTPLQDRRSRVPVALCNNGDVLTVLEVGGPGEWGAEVKLRREQTGSTITTEFLSERDIDDRGHPYNVRLNELDARARGLQKDFLKADPRTRASIDPDRRAAWSEFFLHKQSTVLSAAHCFATTSHKAQGSTYRQVFVDAADMAPFDHRALYVGVTRPSQELVVG